MAVSTPGLEREGTVPPLRSRTVTQGRNMAGARALWRATGLTDDGPDLLLEPTAGGGEPLCSRVDDLAEYLAASTGAARDVSQVER